MTQQQQQPIKLDAASTRAFLLNTPTTVVDTQSPLREFEGVLKDVEVEVLQGERGAYHRLTLKFIEMIVYRSITNWPYPVGELKFSKSGDEIRSSTPLGMLIAPIDNIWGPGKNLLDLISHKLYIDFTPNHPRRVQNQDTKQWVDELIEAYEIIAIDGQRAGPEGVAGTEPSSGVTPQVTGMSANDTLLGHLGIEGKTQAQFNQAVLSDQDFQSRFNAEWNSVLASSESVLQSLIGMELIVREGEGDEAIYKPV